MPRHRCLDDWITGNDGYDRDANERDPFEEQEKQYRFHLTQMKRAEGIIDLCIKNNVRPSGWARSWCPRYRREEWPE